MQILSGHISPETAYLVDDYPYGFRLRCKIRYWLEFKKGKGFRFVSQTTNPQLAYEKWNAPKASTYARLGGAMYLDDNNHVEWAQLSEYDSTERVGYFLAKYGDTMPDEARAYLEKVHATKLVYDQKKAAGMDWRQAAHEAVKEVVILPEIAEMKAARIAH
jgi:hypothetical protein